MPRDAMRGPNRRPREKKQFADKEGAVWPVSLTRRNAVLVNGNYEDGRARRAIDTPNVYTGPLPPGTTFEG